MTNHDSMQKFIDKVIVFENKSDRTVEIGLQQMDLPGSIVAITVRREGGDKEIYSKRSMTEKTYEKMVQELTEFMSKSIQVVRLNEHSFSQDEKQGGRLSHRSASSSAGPSESHGTLDSPINKAAGRKRKRPALSRKISEAANCIFLQNEEEVLAFYRRVLEQSQQSLCRKIAKWWIRAIIPNKQTNFPYAKGAEKKPPWWPPTPPNDARGEPMKGTKENGFVRHREPDHLNKPERLTLLPYILNMVTDPCKRRDINNIDVTKLHQISIDSINNENMSKEKRESGQNFMAEIFRVAYEQEKYRNGEIDQAAQIEIPPKFRYRSSECVTVGADVDEESEHDIEQDNYRNDTWGVPSEESVSEQELHTQNHTEPQFPHMDIKPEYSTINPEPHHIYGGPTVQQAIRYPVSTSMVQDSSCSHLDAPRFPNHHSFSALLNGNGISKIPNSLYQTSQPLFQPSITSSIPNTVLPSIRPTIKQTSSPLQFSVIQDTELFLRQNVTYQNSSREQVLGDREHILHFSPQRENFQDFFESQNFGGLSL